MTTPFACLGGDPAIRRTYTGWMDAAKDPRVAVVFDASQRARWLARKVIARWRQRIWMRRTQCNVSLIEMTPVADADALFLTDTTHKQIFRFHRSDIYNTLLFNLSLSSYMLPTPRAPTNPWTNKPLTPAQTIAICQSLLRDFAARGVCPPPLFSCFWQARFDLRTFERVAAPMLSYVAITNYFKELCPDNLTSVCTTISTLITRCGHYVSEERVRQWLQQGPPEQAEWLALVRDYIIYINLHIQVRPTWYGRDEILEDVRALYSRTSGLGVSVPPANPSDIMSFYVSYLLANTGYQVFTTSFNVDVSHDSLPDLIEPDEMTGISDTTGSPEMTGSPDGSETPTQ